MNHLQSSTSSAIPAGTSVDADATFSREVIRLGDGLEPSPFAAIDPDAQTQRHSIARDGDGHSSGGRSNRTNGSHSRKSRFKFGCPSYLQLYSRSCSTPLSRLFVVVAVLLAIAAGAPIPIIAVIFGKLIDSFPSTEDEVRSRLSQFLITAVVFLVLTYGWSASFGILGERVASHHRKAVVEKLLRLDIASLRRLQHPQSADGDHLDHREDDEATRLDIDSILTSRAHTIQIATSEKAGLMLQSLAYFVAAFITAFTLNARVAGILFAAIVPAMLAIIVVTNRQTSRCGKESNLYEGTAHATAEQSINGIATVQTLGIMDKMVRLYSTQLQKRQIWETRKSIWTASMLGTIFFVTYGANALAYFLAGRPNSSSDQTSAGTIFALVTLVIDASFVIAQVGPLLQFFSQGADAGAELRIIIDTPTSYIDPLSRHGDEVLRARFDSPIELRDVGFTYEGSGGVSVLEKLSFSIPPKAMTGVVGASGSGKSTITALLLRLYDPTSGNLTLDGCNLTSFNLASYRKLVAIVSQDNVVFPGTIMENLCYGLDHEERRSMSRDEMARRCNTALNAAECSRFVDELPLGINTVITSSNELSSLSGGQKQRLALARALIREPELLILDEFTSALDSKTERAIMRTLKHICLQGKTTVVVIAHRLRTIREANKIIVMDHGRLLEEGSHEDLVSRKGSYWRLLSSQTRRASRGAHQGDAKRDANSGATLTKVMKDEYSATSSSEESQVVEKPGIETSKQDNNEQKKIGLGRSTLR